MGPKKKVASTLNASNPKAPAGQKVQQKTAGKGPVKKQSTDEMSPLAKILGASLGVDAGSLLQMLGMSQPKSIDASKRPKGVAKAKGKSGSTTPKHDTPGTRNERRKKARNA